MSRVAPAALALGILALAASPARAYDTSIHALLVELGGVGDPQPVPGASPEDLRAFRGWLYGLGVSTPDGALAGRIRAAWPTADAFSDPFVFKTALSLSPEADVWGVDRGPGEALPASRLLGEAATQPDTDARNQDRFARGPDRTVLREPSGAPVPADPAILWFGARQGLASQAHAHYGLTEEPHSDDPEVLKADPRRFTLPAEARAFGADFAETYTLLAFAASRFPHPTGETLLRLFEGAAFHHVQDVCNQVHAIQVGIYDFFVSAKVQSLIEDLQAGGGLLRARKGFQGIGVNIVSNHHLHGEALWAKRVREARAAETAAPREVSDALSAISRDDEDLLADVARRSPEGSWAGFGRALTQAIVERSAPEGAEVYRAVREATRGSLQSRYVTFQDGRDDPDAFLADPRDARVQAPLLTFYRLQGLGFRRAGTAGRAWERRLAAFRAAAPASGPPPAGADASALVSAPVPPDDPALRAVVDAFFRQLLDARDATAARLAAYTPAPAGGPPLSIWVFGVYPLPLVFVGAVVAWHRRRLRRGSA